MTKNAVLLTCMLSLVSGPITDLRAEEPNNHHAAEHHKKSWWKKHQTKIITLASVAAGALIAWLSYRENTKPSHHTRRQQTVTPRTVGRTRHRSRDTHINRDSLRSTWGDALTALRTLQSLQTEDHTNPHNPERLNGLIPQAQQTARTVGSTPHTPGDTHINRGPLVSTWGDALTAIRTLRSSQSEYIIDPNSPELLNGLIPQGPQTMTPEAVGNDPHLRAQAITAINRELRTLTPDNRNMIMKNVETAREHRRSTALMQSSRSTHHQDQSTPAGIAQERYKTAVQQIKRCLPKKTAAAAKRYIKEETGVESADGLLFYVANQIRAKRNQSQAESISDLSDTEKQAAADGSLLLFNAPLLMKARSSK